MKIPRPFLWRNMIYRAGWSDKGNKRIGWLWVWVGPYIIGFDFNGEL